MNNIRWSLAIIGIVTVLGGLTPSVYAQPLPTLIAQKSADDFYNQGIEKYKARDLKGAIADFTEAIRLNPKLAQIYVMRGNTYYDQGDKEAALKDYNQALSIEPNDAVTYVERGNARDDLGDSKGAIEDYNKAITIQPDLATAYGNRAITYLRMNNKEAALADFQKSAQLYKQQGNTERYQDALNKIKSIQQPTSTNSLSSFSRVMQAG